MRKHSLTAPPADISGAFVERSAWVTAPPPPPPAAALIPLHTRAENGHNAWLVNARPSPPWSFLPPFLPWDIHTQSPYEDSSAAQSMRGVYCVGAWDDGHRASGCASADALSGQSVAGFCDSKTAGSARGTQGG